MLINWQSSGVIGAAYSLKQYFESDSSMESLLNVTISVSPKLPLLIIAKAQSEAQNKLIWHRAAFSGYGCFERAIFRFLAFERKVATMVFWWCLNCDICLFQNEIVEWGTTSPSPLKRWKLNIGLMTVTRHRFKAIAQYWDVPFLNLHWDCMSQLYTYKSSAS